MYTTIIFNLLVKGMESMKRKAKKLICIDYLVESKLLDSITYIFNRIIFGEWVQEFNNFDYTAFVLVFTLSHCIIAFLLHCNEKKLFCVSFYCYVIEK